MSSSEPPKDGQIIIPSQELTWRNSRTTTSSDDEVDHFPELKVEWAGKCTGQSLPVATLDRAVWCIWRSIRERGHWLKVVVHGEEVLNAYVDSRNYTRQWEIPDEDR